MQPIQAIEEARRALLQNNLRLSERRNITPRKHRLQKVLVANRGEIAKRFCFALHEEGIPSVAVVTDPDVGQSWYEFADETIYIGDRSNYTNAAVIVAAAIESGANAIYPGYGFLSEDVRFVDLIEEAAQAYETELFFMGPGADVMRKVGAKLAARTLAQQNNVPVFAGSESIRDEEHARSEAARIGYPVLIKLDAGGGGKGMSPVFAENELADAIESTRRIGQNLYGDDSFYLEKLIQKPVHIEVQIFNGLAVGIRKCAVQRRNQKIIEESGHSFLQREECEDFLAAAENMAQISGYAEGAGAGTVEFLYDAQTGEFGFLEMNTRLQVEYAVTDQSMGLDLAKWQIRFFDNRPDEIPFEEVRRNRLDGLDHAIECRIYAEDPENDYAPSPGAIHKLDLPTFNGIRNDFGFREGDRVLPDYDPMIGKIIAHGATRAEALVRLERVLQEIYVKGIHTNIKQLLKIVRHAAFQDLDYTNRILPDNPELESDAEAGDGLSDRRKATPVLFAAFAEYLYELRSRAEQLTPVDWTGGDGDSRAIQPYDYAFHVAYEGESYHVELIQSSINSFYAYVNGRLNAKDLKLTTPGRTEDDFLINFGSRSIRLRADRRANYTVLRIKDRDNKVQYYRLKVRAASEEEGAGARDALRAPFQGIFVKFANNRNEGRQLQEGDAIEKGDPVLVISAMKMETTIYAERSGRVSYLIENGDAKRLQLGKTPDGKILGKPIGEGEVLAVIEADSVATNPEANEEKPHEQFYFNEDSRDILDNIYNKKLTQIFFWDPDGNLPTLVHLLRAYLEGFTPPSPLIDRLAGILKSLAEENLLDMADLSMEAELTSAIGHYRRIKKAFSPTIVADLPHYIELNLYMAHLKDGDYKPSPAFRHLIEKEILAHYELDRLARSDEDLFEVKRQAFLHIHMSRLACTESKSIIRHFLHLLSRLPKTSALHSREEREVREATRTELRLLMQHELTELDDSLAEDVRSAARQLFPEGLETGAERRSRAEEALERSIQDFDPFLFFPEDREATLAKMKSSLLEDPSGDTAPVKERGPVHRLAELRGRLAKLAEKHSIQSLYSPLEDVFIFLAHHRENPKTKYYVCFSFTDESAGAPTEEQARGPFFCRQIWAAAVPALSVLIAYAGVQKHKGNRIEVLADSRIRLDAAGRSGASINYWQLQENMNLNAGAAERLFAHIDRALVHLQPEGGSTPGPAQILAMFSREERFLFDLLAEDDPRNPYYDAESHPVDARTQKLFAKDKWPVEFWLRACMSQESLREIRIPSIDEVLWTNPKSGKEEVRPVGAKLFSGEMEGVPALFFMKDSRISGGATGDLEGRKYVAAAFIAYKTGQPLYVWNDGAGANIKEGVVSLNRAAQGFMMNTLLAENADAETFAMYTRFNPDPMLRELFSELDARYGAELPAVHKPVYIVAVGVGSSAGLDVYGSSQATLQVLLDSEESYRVLTGSNVIKSVTAEDFTNYEIGGARVMSAWTGIVDFVARDKLHLAAIIRRLHALFAVSRAMSMEADRNGAGKRSPVDGPRPWSRRIVLNEAIVRAAADGGDFWQLKEEYHGSGSVIGGFARLNGHRTLILGARSQYGFRAAPAVIRARELLRIANRTQSHRVFVLGARFLGRAIEDASNIRPRLDFLRTTAQATGVHVNIVTHFEGLRNAETHAFADAIIFLHAENAPERRLQQAKKNAAFLVTSYQEAFSLAGRVIDLLSPRPQETHADATGEGVNGQGAPEIPADASQPYDMVANVIERAFDAGSFLEFYKDMNDPQTGPSLITGLARLNGRSVGIIADQPAIMGGAPDAPGTEKFRVFTELLNRRGIPLVMLSNAPGFVPGTRQERLRIQAIGAESLDANILGRIPVVSVVLNQNYGGRQIHAFSKFLRPGIVYIAYENAQIAVMGAGAAFDLFEGGNHAKLVREGKEQEAVELHRRFTTAFKDKARAASDAASTGVLDWTFPEPARLREELLRGMELAIERTQECFGPDYDKMAATRQ